MYYLVILLASWLAGCGQPVCVGGVGQCDTAAKFLPPNSGGLTFVPRTGGRTVGLGLTITLVASGGTTPYQFVIDHADMSPPGTLTPQGDGTSVLFQAPSTAGWVYLRVYDSQSPTKRYADLPLQVTR